MGESEAGAEGGGGASAGGDASATKAREVTSAASGTARGSAGGAVAVADHIQYALKQVGAVRAFWGGLNCSLFGWLRDKRLGG